MRHHRDGGVVKLLVFVVKKNQLRPQVRLLRRTENLVRRIQNKAIFKVLNVTFFYVVYNFFFNVTFRDDSDIWGKKDCSIYSETKVKLGDLKKKKKSTTIKFILQCQPSEL